MRAALAIALLAAALVATGLPATAVPQQESPPAASEPEAADPPATSPSAEPEPGPETPAADPTATAAEPEVVAEVVAETVAPEATLRISAPSEAATGEPFSIEVEVDVTATVAAYRVDVSAADTEIEPTGIGLRANDDVVTDRSVGSLGDRAVLAATSCPAEGCDRGGAPEGASGTLPLGTLAVTPSAPGPLTVTVALTELAGPDGALIGATPVAETTVTIDVAGPAPVEPVEVVTTDGPETDPHAGDPVPEPPDPEADFAADVADGCDPADPTCATIAAVQAAETTLSTTLPTSPNEAGTGATAAAASAGGLTLIVDTTSDAHPAYDVNLGDGACVSPSGECTLRAAMQEANAFPGPVTINFDLPGVGPHTIQLASNLPATTDDAGVTIDGYSQPGASANTDPLASNAVIMVEVRGNGPSSHDALKIRSDNNTITGLAIYDARRPIWMFEAGNNRIVGNFVGTDASGTFQTGVLAPTAHGIHIEGQSAGNVIGTSALADRNVVSGNARHGIGIWHHNSDDNVIQNNIVGLSPDGTTALPNAKHGIDVNFGAARTVIGGLGPDEGNVVSANLDSGIEVSHNPADAQGLVRDMSTLVQGNRIGTFTDGGSSSSLTANLNTGVFIEDGVTNTVVEGNTIGGNLKGGIRVLNGGTNGVTTGTVIRNNWIGRSPSGTPMANGMVGVAVDSSTTVVGPGNTIGHTVGPAIASSELDALSNTVTENTMVANTGLGIELSPTGTNPNDPGDGDTGPNELLNWPDVTRATDAVFEGTVCHGCRVELFAVDASPGAGLAGGTHLATTMADPATGAFSAPNPGVAVGAAVTATTTDAAGNTSEFAPSATVIEHSDPPVLDAGPDVSVDEGGTVTLTATATDPDDDFITFAWDLDDDGSFETPGSTVSFDAALIDGPASRLVTAQATDDTGLTATDSLTVTVDNVAPTGSLDLPTIVDEAATFSVSVLGAADPSPADVAAGLRFAITCPGETVTPDYATASTSSARTCTAPDGPSAPAIEAHVLDDDGGVTVLSAAVTVDNVPPVVVIGGVPTAADEGDQLSLTTSVSDVSVDDEAAGFTFSWTVLLEGVTVSTGTETDPTLVLDLTDSGLWTITVAVTDVDGGVGTDTRQLTVDNVDPTAELTTNVVITGQVDVHLDLINVDEPGPDDQAAGLRYGFDFAAGSLASVTEATADPSPSTVCSFT
ncbi:MAG: right-handed parallel beta-helix repeat-containing protein, partial [Actinomycetota bacterium]